MCSPEDIPQDMQPNHFESLRADEIRFLEEKHVMEIRIHTFSKPPKGIHGASTWNRYGDFGAGRNRDIQKQVRAFSTAEGPIGWYVYTNTFSDKENNTTP